MAVAEGQLRWGSNYLSILKWEQMINVTTFFIISNTWKRIHVFKNNTSLRITLRCI